MGSEVTASYLKNGVTIENLFNGKVDQEKIEKIKDCAKGGFTEDELQTLEADGIDIDLLKDNFADSKTDEDIQKKADDLKKIYCSDLAEFTGDKNSYANPELQQLEKAINNGVLKNLADEGYTKMQIIEIISIAFPNTGIQAKEDGKYDIPIGHDDQAKDVYTSFTIKLLEALGEDPEEISSAKDKLNDLKTQIAKLDSEITTLEYKISTEQDEIEKEMTEAIDKSTEIAEEQKEEAKNTVNSALNEYVNSKGEMTYEEFQQGLKSDLDGIAGTTDSKLSSVILTMLNCSDNMETLNADIKSLGGLYQKKSDLQDQASKAESELNSLIEDQKNNVASADEDANMVDPIGFTHNNTRYDFFVDKDNNNDLSNESEFLGAKNGFMELISLDTNKDNKVDASELSKSDIKVVVTHGNGSQNIKDAKEVFDSSDFIDLASYSEKNTALSNGNQLLGTFDVQFDDTLLDDKGYQTLDNIDWLNENYDFSDNKNSIGSSLSQEAIEKKLSDYTAQADDLEKRLFKAQGKVDDNIDVIQNKTIQQAQRSANSKGIIASMSLENNQNDKNVQEKPLEELEEIEEIEKEKDI